MRLIDADALELILNNAIEMMRTMAKALDSEDDPKIQMEIKAYTDILTGVKEQPTVQPERKTGSWLVIKRGERGYSASGFRCSVCGRPSDSYTARSNYCSYCGADMRDGACEQMTLEDMMQRGGDTE